MSVLAANRAAESSLLAVQEVSKSFGAVVALKDVTFDVPSATISGVVGPNGSGKTSLLNVLAGLMRPDSGRVMLDGEDATRRSAAYLAKRGVGRTFQTPRIFPELDMWEHIEVGLESATRDESNSTFAKAIGGLQTKWGGLDVTALPHGSQRLLEILRVMARMPRVLLLDEPAAGLSLQERAGVADLLRSIRDSLGTAIVLVEHDLSLVWRVADSIAVMDQGAVIEMGEPEEIKNKPSVAALFMGGGHAAG
jgi:branched-chain amino acid transport system permease protein